VGTWRLVRANATAADGTKLPAPYGGDKAMGRATFNTEGRMLAVLCDGRPELPPGEAREYASYCGNYTFDGTRVGAAPDPTHPGSDQVRKVRFESGLMVLRPPLRTYAAGTEQRELWWEKIAEMRPTSPTRPQRVKPRQLVPPPAPHPSHAPEPQRGARSCA
jgi:hypothetical protein